MGVLIIALRRNQVMPLLMLTRNRSQSNLIDAPSPNFDARKAVPDCVILHYTGMESGAAALERMRDPEAKVSAHYMVDEDGAIYRLVPEERRAWHAGAAFWKGVKDINSASIGIEIVNPGHEFGYRPFPDAQVAAVINLLADIRSRWTIDDDRILGHSDVAPGRKIDPGELFPWKRLARSRPRPVGRAAAVARRAAGPGRGGDRRLRPAGRPDPPGLQLRAVAASTTSGPTTVVAAFQRHWLQTRFDGVADGETRARLVALLRAAG